MAGINETLGQHRIRLKTVGHYKPLRTSAELADELKVSHAFLRGHLGKLDAPKPVIGRKNKMRNNYYDPDEVKAWYARKLAR